MTENKERDAGMFHLVWPHPEIISGHVPAHVAMQVKKGYCDIHDGRGRGLRNIFLEKMQLIPSFIDPHEQRLTKLVSREVFIRNRVLR